MEPYDPRGGTQPESVIQDALTAFLKKLGWSVKSTHGSIMQYGVPDLFITHPKHGYRWVDVKVPGRYRITPAQYDYWAELCRHGSGVWIITAATIEEYNKLFIPYNWHTYIPVGKDPERRELRVEMDKIINFYHTKQGNLK